MHWVRPDKLGNLLNGIGCTLQIIVLQHVANVKTTRPETTLRDRLKIALLTRRLTHHRTTLKLIDVSSERRRQLL